MPRTAARGKFPQVHAGELLDDPDKEQQHQDRDHTGCHDHDRHGFNKVVERVRCPVLLFSAETDHSVRPEAQSQFISRVENGRLIPVHHSRHEIFRSTDDVLYPWWHEVLEFLQGAVKNAHGTGIEK